jgi:prepilin-type N-terminal cleavage/methylation domain-containing protein
MKIKGFTLIELIVVIVVIGVLAVIAIPKYINLTDQANQAARDKFAGAAKTAVSLYFVESLVNGTAAWPTTLTSANFEEGTTFLTNFGGYTWTYSSGNHTVTTN